MFEGPNLVRRAQVNEGKPSVINCPASGSPPPAITWLKDGLPLFPTARFVFLDAGRQLQISNTQPDDRGRYTCIATNTVGTADLETALDVVSPPQINGEKVEKVEVIETHRVDLNCEVSIG